MSSVHMFNKIKKTRVLQNKNNKFTRRLEKSIYLHSCLRNSVRPFAKEFMLIQK